MKPVCCTISLKENVNNMNIEELPKINTDPTNRKLTPVEQYSAELKEDLTLTLGNLREKALTTGSMKAKWVGYMGKEKEALQRLISVRADYQKTLMSQSKTANAFDKLKSVNQDDDTLKKIDAMKKQIELSLEIINHAIASLTEFGYNIKNVIEVVKMNA